MVNYHTYLINLKESSDRLIFSKIELERMGIDYEIFDAVRGYDIKHVVNDINKDMQGWTRGANGLRLTTINILEDAIKNDYESILIMEDDLFFYPNSKMNFDKVLNLLPDSFDLLHFAMSHIIPPSYVNGSLFKVKKGWSCQMYLINRNIFKEYRDLLINNHVPIDYITSEFIHSKDNSYCSYPSIVNTVANYSTIREKFIVHY